MKIIQAQRKHVDKIFSLDHIANVDEERRQFISKSVNEGNANVAINDDKIVGFSILEHSFFNRGFISLLIVHPDSRRTGIGSALIHHNEELCKSDRIFTSTNMSNHRMQKLLKKLGYTYSGIVDNLDEGDPELFYSKQIK